MNYKEKDPDECFHEAYAFLTRKLKRELTDHELQVLNILSDEEQHVHEAFLTLLVELVE